MTLGTRVVAASLIAVSHMELHVKKTPAPIDGLLGLRRATDAAGAGLPPDVPRALHGVLATD